MRPLGAGRVQLGRHLAAGLPAYGQRGSNRQAGGRLNGFGTVPLIADSRPPRFSTVGIDSSRPIVYGHPRLEQDLVDGALLHDLAGVHDDHVVDHLGDDAEVVGDQHQRRRRSAPGSP